MQEQAWLVCLDKMAGNILYADDFQEYLNINSKLMEEKPFKFEEITGLMRRLNELENKNPEFLESITCDWCGDCAQKQEAISVEEANLKWNIKESQRRMDEYLKDLSNYEENLMGHLVPEEDRQLITNVITACQMLVGKERTRYKMLKEELRNTQQEKLGGKK